MTMTTRRMNLGFVLALLSLTVASANVVQAQTESRSATQMSAAEVAGLEPSDWAFSDAHVTSGRACTTDQSSLSSPLCMATFDQTDLAQSFIPSQPYSCGGMILLFPAYGSPGTVTIELWDGLPNAGGTMMATGSDPAAAPGGSASVTWPPVAVTPGNTYYLVFTADAAGQEMCIGGDANNPYPLGNVFANGGFNPFPNYDYAFESFGDTVPVELQRFEVE